MSSPKKRTKPQPAAPEAPAGMSIRGLTAEDHAAIARAVERRRVLIGGGYVSANNAVLALLRAALAIEDARDAILTPKASA